MTPGEILSLLVWLPEDSATSAAFLGGPHWRGWTMDRALLRDVHVFTHAAVSSKKVQAVDLPTEPRGSSRRVSSLSGIPGAVRRTEG